MTRIADRPLCYRCGFRHLPTSPCPFGEPAAQVCDSGSTKALEEIADRATKKLLDVNSDYRWALTNQIIFKACEEAAALQQVRDNKEEKMREALGGPEAERLADSILAESAAKRGITPREVLDELIQRSSLRNRSAKQCYAHELRTNFGGILNEAQIQHFADAALFHFTAALSSSEASE